MVCDMNTWVLFGYGALWESWDLDIPRLGFWGIWFGFWFKVWEFTGSWEYLISLRQGSHSRGSLDHCIGYWLNISFFACFFACFFAGSAIMVVELSEIIFDMVIM